MIAIENKIDAGLYNPWDQYESAVMAEFADLKPLFVLLSPDRSDVTEDGWVPYGYADIHRVLTRCQKINAGRIGNDVAAFLEHYLRLIGSRFMDDSNIEQLCKQIYKNHRQAIALIYEYAGSPAAGLIGRFETLLQENPNRWHLVNTTSQSVIFVPKPWLELFPGIGRRPNFDSRLWIVFQLKAGQTKVRWQATAWPTHDADLRRRIIERLTKDKDEFKLRVFSKKIMGEDWTRIGNEPFADTPEEDSDEQAVIDVAKKKLDLIWERLEKVPAALKPIFDEWHKSHP